MGARYQSVNLPQIFRVSKFVSTRLILFLMHYCYWINYFVLQRSAYENFFHFLWKACLAFPQTDKHFKWTTRLSITCDSINMHGKHGPYSLHMGQHHLPTFSTFRNFVYPYMTWICTTSPGILTPLDELGRRQFPAGFHVYLLKLLY